MTVWVPVGSRFRANAGSRGRVSCRRTLTPGELDRFLTDASLEPLTYRTVTDAEQLRGLLEGVVC